MIIEKDAVEKERHLLKADVFLFVCIIETVQYR